MDISGKITIDTYQQLAHFVECPICYTIYDKPMQMGCGHTFCSTCIGSLVERVKTPGATEIKCPECRKPTTVPVDGLPVNYRIQEIESISIAHSVLKMDAKYAQCAHFVVEKKALTSEDVRVIKEKINEASARACEALKNIKPQFESVGGSVEKKVVEKLESFLKIFDFMLNSFDSKIKDTSTMDELMVEVKKAEQVAETYEKGRKTDELMAAIERAIEEYLKPFEKLKQELKFQADIPDIAGAPAPDTPPTHAARAPPPPPPSAYNFLAEALIHGSRAGRVIDDFAQQPANVSFSVHPTAPCRIMGPPGRRMMPGHFRQLMRLQQQQEQLQQQQQPEQDHQQPPLIDLLSGFGFD
ncbi:hypothetical protein GCK72_021445 [Caenorhabditis remanei]|uniref:RING-type domain-containing protein n=1 Tax=Caenorhabditis remanei TaxID=31234 RepID=A0A6A5GI62_CAERE|nr:hypothetical protein GCK72_021445 [Caenorhabditis remanei]KAF1754880.1 hypothetical protein GCK72_021445 [Caenorhabditis remanei]